MKEHNTQSRTAYRSQLKEHKKLYKSGKNWMAATLLTVGLAGGAMLVGNTTANADVLPAQSSETAQTITDNSELAQTQADAQKQQQTIDNGNAQLNKQNQQLSDLQGQQASAQQKLGQAKQAQQQATASDPAVQQAQKDVDQAQQQVNNQQIVVGQASDAVQNNQKAVQSASDAVNQAQAEVEHQRDIAKQATEQSADKMVNEAQNKIDQLESQGKAQASQQLDNQINNVSGQVTDAQNDVNNTNSQISNLQGQVKGLQDQEKNSQTDPNIKKVPNGYIDITKSLLENVARGNLWAPADMNANTNGNITPQNLYVSPDDDKGNESGINKNHDADSSLSIYDPYYDDRMDYVNAQTGMTDSQKQELAIMLMNIVNHAREDRGLKPFTMTEQKYNQAQVRASQPKAASLTHDMNDIISAFGRDQYECLAYISTSGTGDMLSMLYSAGSTLSSMLNADASSDWGHRENFLWDTGDSNYDAAFGFHYIYDNNTDSYMYVLTFDFDGPAHNNTPNMMDRIANYAAMGPITPSANTVDNSAKINNLNNQISSLQNTLATQKAKLNKLQNDLQNLQAQKANVQFDLSQLTSDQQAEYSKAQNELQTANDQKQCASENLDSNSNVKDALNKVDAKKSELQSAKNILQQSLNDQKQAQQGLDSLKQELATKQAALDKAEQKANASANKTVKDAQAKLDSINNQIAGLQNDIATTKATISQAQAQLDQDNKKIANLKNKPAAKPDDGKGSETPSTPSTGKNDNKGGETPTQTAQPTNPDTGNASISGQASHQPAKSDNGSQEAGNTGTNKPTIVLPTTSNENATNTGSQGQYINVVSKNSVASQAGIQAPASMETTSVSFGTKTSEPMTREAYKAQQANLPQTGDENGKAVIALGVLGGMFGLGLAVKGKKEF